MRRTRDSGILDGMQEWIRYVVLEDHSKGGEGWISRKQSAMMTSCIEETTKNSEEKLQIIICHHFSLSLQGLRWRTSNSPSVIWSAYLHRITLQRHTQKSRWSRQFSFRIDSEHASRFRNEHASIQSTSIYISESIFINWLYRQDEIRLLFLDNIQTPKDQVSTPKTNNTIASRRIAWQCRWHSILYHPGLENPFDEKVSISLRCLVDNQMVLLSANKQKIRFILH